MMAAFTEQQAQRAMDQIMQLCSQAAQGAQGPREIARALEPGLRALIKDLGAGDDGKLPGGAWSQIAEHHRNQLQSRMGGMLDALESATAGADEPQNPTSFMYRVHASNGWIYLLVCSSIVVIALLLWGVFRYWNVATSTKALEADVLRMVILMGALGGTIHWMSSLVNFVGNGNLFRRWIPYYLLAPFQGAALAVLIYLLLRVGVLASPANSAEHLNLLGLYAFAGLTGLFAKQAIEMLRDVFAVMFKKIEAKDASGSSKPPPAGAPKQSGAQPAGGGDAG